jgi:hypothetical protein
MRVCDRPRAHTARGSRFYGAFCAGRVSKRLSLEAFIRIGGVATRASDVRFWIASCACTRHATGDKRRVPNTIRVAARRHRRRSRRRRTKPPRGQFDTPASVRHATPARRRNSSATPEKMTGHFRQRAISEPPNHRDGRWGRLCFGDSAAGRTRRVSFSMQTSRGEL